MRFFELLGLQHVILFAFPAIIFIILFYLGITHSHFHGKNSKEKLTKSVHSYSHGLESRNAPFPIILMLIIAGIVIWTFLYTIGTGILGVQI